MSNSIPALAHSNSTPDRGIPPPRRGLRIRACSASWLLVLAGAFLAPVSAWATAESGQARAYGVAAEVAVATVLEVNAGPTPLAEGQAPPAFSHQDSIATLTVSSSQGALVETGLLTVEAASSVPAAAQTTASAVVHDLRVLEGLTAGQVSLQAEEVATSSQVNGSCGPGLNANGATALVNARLRIGAVLPTFVDLAANPAPNSTVYNDHGVHIILNEQSVSGDGESSAAVAVSAIVVRLRNALVGTTLLNGDIVIAHSQASAQCADAAAGADLWVTLSSDPETAVRGLDLDYLVTVGNDGPATAPHVTLVSTLPAEVTLLQATPSQGTCSPGQTVVCSLGTLVPTAQATVVIRVRVEPHAPSTLSKRAEASSAAPDPDPSRAVAILVTPVRDPEVGDPPPSDDPSPPPGICPAPAGATMLLDDGRFRVKASWRTPDGQQGQGQAVRLSKESGVFWFFSPTNIELMVKVLNGCAFTGHYWVFASGLTNVQVDLEVLDLATGQEWTTHHAMGPLFEPVADIHALSCS